MHTSCVDDHAATDTDTEGPFFTVGSLLRTNLVTAGVTGVLLNLTGCVRSETCAPVPGALIEFWQADSAGNYDDTGYTLRGHQYTAATGGYTLATVVPKDYRSGGTHRTPHLHVKVQAPGAGLVSTELFFPDTTNAYGLNFAALNAQDGLINRACTLSLGTLAANTYPATFDFVVPTR